MIKNILIVIIVVMLIFTLLPMNIYAEAENSHENTPEPTGEPSSESRGDNTFFIVIIIMTFAFGFYSMRSVRKKVETDRSMYERRRRR